MESFISYNNINTIMSHEVSKMWLRMERKGGQAQEMPSMPSRPLELEAIEAAETYKVRIVGIRPLLMHAPAMLGDKPKFRRGEHLEPKQEAELYLYKDDDRRVCIPAANIKACIREAGRNYKIKGRGSTFAAMIRAGIRIEPAMIPLIDPQTGTQPQWVIDSRPVVVQRQRIIRHRPRFDRWALEFNIINLDPSILHKDTLKRILIDAGKYYGLGDFRPEFGLFKVEEFT